MAGFCNVRLIAVIENAVALTGNWSMRIATGLADRHRLKVTDLYCWFVLTNWSVTFGP